MPVLSVESTDNPLEEQTVKDGRVLFDRETAPLKPNFGTRPELAKNDETPDVGEVFGAAFRTENTIGSFFSDETQKSEFDSSFDPFDDLTGYEVHASSFVEANTPEDVDTIKRQIDREGQDRKLIEDAGSVGVIANLVSGVLDPINLIPVGGAAVKAYSVGGSILKGAANTARAGIVGATVAETALHATQETRTLGESVVNVAGAALLSGVLGGAVGIVKGNQLAKSAKALEEDLVVTHPDKLDPVEPNSMPVTGESAGAAAVRNTTIEQETLSNAWGMEKLAATLKINPKIRLAVSASVEARRFIQELAETPFYYQKNDEGIANPIALESIIDLSQAKIARAIGEQKDLFRTFKDRVKKEGGDKLSYTQFKEEVGKASVRGDKHPIPEVQRLAEVYRKEVLDPMKEGAIKVGLLSEDVKTNTATSYLHRWWDKEVIKGRREELQGVIHQGLRALPEIKTKDGAIMHDDELSEIADDIIDRLLGSADTRSPYDIPLQERGPLKERTLDFIKDVDVEDFLVKDIEAVARKYLRTMSSDIAIKDWFGTLDVIGTEGFITTKIRDEYRGLIKKAKTEKAKSKLQDALDNDIIDIEAVVNQLRGTYGQPNNPDSTIVRAGRVTRKLQAYSKLGGMTASAFADIARPVMVHGFSRTVMDGVVPLIKSFKTFKMSALEVKESGAALDMTLDSRIMNMAEINNPYVKGSKFEKGVDAIGGAFGRITMMTQWNTALKQFSGVVTQGRIVDGVKASVAGSISKKDARYLNMIGIDAAMSKRVAKELSKNGMVKDGVTIANASAWKDIGAQTAFRTAIKKEVDRIIVTPGVGDIPLWMKGSETGKMIGQFKSFSMASTNKTLISGLQEADMQTMVGWQMAVGLGMAAYAFKTWDRGGELSDDPLVWLQEGVDRSGLLGILSEINQISNKVTRGTVSMQALAGAPPLTRYASSNVAGLLLGPTLGSVTDVAQIVGAGATGEWTVSDTRAARRLIPYQNLLLARQMFDKMEDGINNSLGVK